MAITFAARGVGKPQRKRRRRNPLPVHRIFKEGSFRVGVVADSRRLLEVHLSSRKRVSKSTQRVKLLPSQELLFGKAKRMLHDYFRKGKPLGKLPVDWSRQSSFQRKVLCCARRIPFGEVRSYGWVAREVGTPRGARACGQALRRNRFPLFIPCHRVVGRSGSGGFACGVRLKEKLLSHERHFSRGGRP